MTTYPHKQIESWNIHRTNILICSITLNGTESQPSPSTSGLRVTLSYLHMIKTAPVTINISHFQKYDKIAVKHVVDLCR